MTSRRFAIAFLVGIALAACDGPSFHHSPDEANRSVFPGSSWEAIPQAELSRACLDSLHDATTSLQSGATNDLMAVQDGRVLFTYGNVETVTYIASARKSVLAMLYGKYVANGTINLDATMAELGIDDIGGLLPIERTAKLRDLLTARSGVYHPASNGGDDSANAPPRGSQTPGTYFLYNNWDFNAAGAAFELLTKQDIYQAFAHDLAGPLQLQDFQLSRQKREGDKSRSEYSAYHFYLSTRDMARIGYLMLNHGNWHGQQLVPADWVTKITTPVTTSAEMHHPSSVPESYGYLWWILEEPAPSPLNGAYLAHGLFGQFILVIPNAHMVIAHKREFPFPGNDKRPVSLRDFLSIARVLAGAPCH